MGVDAPRDRLDIGVEAVASLCVEWFSGGGVQVVVGAVVFEKVVELRRWTDRLAEEGGSGGRSVMDSFVLVQESSSPIFDVLVF